MGGVPGGQDKEIDQSAVQSNGFIYKPEQNSEGIIFALAADNCITLKCCNSYIKYISNKHSDMKMKAGSMLKRVLF